LIRESCEDDAKAWDARGSEQLPFDAQLWHELSQLSGDAFSDVLLALSAGLLFPLPGLVLGTLWSAFFIQISPSEDFWPGEAKSTFTVHHIHGTSAHQI